MKQAINTVRDIIGWSLFALAMSGGWRWGKR